MTKDKKALSSKQEDKVSGGYVCENKTSEQKPLTPTIPIMSYGGQCMQQDQVIKLIKSEESK